MKEIFTDLYRKVLGFFQTQEKSSEESKTVAVNRMKLVLMQDRTNLTPLLLEKLRGEMIDVLSKYVEMDKDALELNFEQEGEQMALMLSIPVLRAKEEEEINAALEAEKQQKAENDNSAISENELAEDKSESPKTDSDEDTEETNTENDTGEGEDEENDEENEEDEQDDKCAQCDCENKNKDIACEDCDKAETCECKNELDECKADEIQEVKAEQGDNDELKATSETDLQKNKLKKKNK